MSVTPTWSLPTIQPDDVANTDPLCALRQRITPAASGVGHCSTHSCLTHARHPHLCAYTLSSHAPHSRTIHQDSAATTAHHPHPWMPGPAPARASHKHCPHASSQSPLTSHARARLSASRPIAACTRASLIYVRSSRLSMRLPAFSQPVHVPGPRVCRPVS